MKNKTPFIVLIVLTVCLCCLPLGALVFSHPLPVEFRQSIAQGAVYERKVHIQPRLMVAHVVTIKLDTPGVRVLVTPYNPKDNHPLQAQRTSEFARKYGVDIAINGGPFSPWYANSPWDYYPHSGDPVRPRGVTVGDGREMVGRGGPTLYFEGIYASFSEPDRIDNAISGDFMLLQGGELVSGLEDSIAAPRTAVGLSEDRRTLILVVIDGRQPLYSHGATMAELARLMRAYGAHQAMSLDGGGSSTMVLPNFLGLPGIVNSPIHAGIPGWERPVATHLGIFLGE
jgi:hypothetical protein